ANCLANGQVWQATDNGLQGFDQLTGAPTRLIAFGPASATPRHATRRDDALLVFCDDRALYQVSLDPAGAAPPMRILGGDPPGGWSEPWLRRFGASVYIGETPSGFRRVPTPEELARVGVGAWGATYGTGFNVGIPGFVHDGPNGILLTPTT